jgi:uncharacterized protein (DUF433 family)
MLWQDLAQRAILASWLSRASRLILRSAPASPVFAGFGFRWRLLGLMAAGETRDTILKNYPYLESDDIDEALRYAAFRAEDETVELLPTVPAK